MNRGAKLSPLDLLAEIIQRDSLEALRLMDGVLNKIGHEILDDTMLQEKLLPWRHLILQFDRELRQLGESLGRFTTFINSGETNGLDSTDNIAGVDQQLQNVLDKLSTLQKRTSVAYKSLMSNMSIFESKRGIAEAESVAKLTELAFLFIPLTFASSIFSMQIAELDASKPPLSIFLAVSFGLLSFSYGIRLIIRSRPFINLGQRYLKEVREAANLTPGAPIPTFAFVAWFLRLVGIRAIIALFFSALLIVPLATLWSRSMNGGFKAIISILVVAGDVAAVYYGGRALFFWDGRSLRLKPGLFQPIPDKRDERPHTGSATFRQLFPWLFTRFTIYGLLVSVISAGLLAAIWAPVHLARGIKVPFTIVVALVDVVLFFLILRNGVRNRDIPELPGED
jgi:hypothetical protein